MEITTVGVVGLGTMGAGIAEVCARHGYRVFAVEPDADSLERGRVSLSGSTERAVKRGKLTEAERDEVLSRITFSTQLEDLASADLAIGDGDRGRNQPAGPGGRPALLQSGSGAGLRRGRAHRGH